MRKNEFEKWMLTQKRIYNGKLDFYSESAIISRISSLNKLESHFNINIDDKITSIETAKQFLIEIRNANIEDLKHTPLSNAFRHYFKFATGIYIDKIF